MQVVNFTEFRKNLAGNLNLVNDSGDMVVVSRSKGKNVVVMSLEDFNSIQETIHVVSTPANQKRLDGALKEMRAGKSFRHKLSDN
ncbi:MAG TPA: type II toxin-antitoxin system prevent-host-death family antitoxin [Puia sp.]|nr:type II toxin-antitoxin system prevent-host-death family antitoxin [Puia sp.]